MACSSLPLATPLHCGSLAVAQTARPYSTLKQWHESNLIKWHVKQPVAWLLLTKLRLEAFG